MRKVPFWWVVKARSDGWVALFRDWCYMARFPGYSGGGPKQSDGMVHLRHGKAKKFAAKLRAEGADAKVVRVWARLPKPKLPDWLVPCDRRDTISVFRPPTPTCRCWDEWVFEVGHGQNPLVSLFMMYQHWSADSRMEGRFDGAPADVFEEALLRAQALRRAEKRARKEGR